MTDISVLGTTPAASAVARTAQTTGVSAATPPSPLLSVYFALVTRLAAAREPDLDTMHGVNLAGIQVLGVIAEQLLALAATASQTKTVELAPTSIHEICVALRKHFFDKLEGDVHIQEKIVETTESVDQGQTAGEDVTITELEATTIEEKPLRRRRAARTAGR
jgi:hypothetical protein